MKTTIGRIAILSVHTCPLAVLGGKKTGGMNVYIRELSREWGRRGIKVDVFTRSQNPCVPHVNQTLGENARVIHIPAGTEAPLDPEAIYPYLSEFTTHVRNFAAREGHGYDLIYSHYWLSGIVAADLSRSWGVPYAQMFHTLGLMKGRIAGAPDQLTLRDRAEAAIMARADRLIAATPAERTQMLWLYRAPRHKIEIVPPGVDLTRFRPKSETERAAAKTRIGLRAAQRMMLFVGRIEPLKAVDTIFEALAILKTQRPALLDNLVLSIIGGDPDDPTGENAEMERLKALRISLGLSELVTFLGAKDQDVLGDYYAAAEALIMPSDYESFGMVALEAMASGTPVIASQVGGLAFLVRDGINGYHVPVREPSALAAKIGQLLDDPAERARLANGAARAANSYGWPRIADRLLEVFAPMRPIARVLGG